MATTADIKNGLCIEFNNDIYQFVEFQHVKPGKGGAFVRAKMKSLTSGKVIENTWNSGASIDLVRVERRKFQFLYKDETGFNFMDQNTFEQIAVEENKIENGEMLPLLKWLREKIHRFGRLKNAEELCVDITGEKLNFSHFMNYAKEKFNQIYSR